MQITLGLAVLAFVIALVSLQYQLARIATALEKANQREAAREAEKGKP